MAKYKYSKYNKTNYRLERKLNIVKNYYKTIRSEAIGTPIERSETT